MASHIRHRDPVLCLGEYAVLMIVHKHPLRRHEHTFFAEAALLPVSLFVGTNPRSQNAVQGVICQGESSSSAVCLLAAYLDLRCRALDPKSPEFSQTRKILIEFSSDCKEYYQFVQIGHCYIQLKIEKEGSKLVPVSRSRPLQSLCLVPSQKAKCELLQAEESFQDSLIQYVLSKETKREACHSTRFIPNEGVRGCKVILALLACITELRTRSSLPVQRVWEVLHKVDPAQGTYACFERTLISFCGIVQTKFSVEPSNAYESAFKLEVKDCCHSESVSVLLDASKVLFPSNLRPGALASFHRVLLKSFAGGTVLLESIATTLIIVHAVYKWPPDDLRLNNNLQSCKTENSDIDGAQSNTISNLLETFSGRVAIRCRVAAVVKLVLKWSGSTTSISKHSKSLLNSVNFAFGCFLLDDGSGLAECCAYGSPGVETFLGLSMRNELQKAVQTFCSIVQKNGTVYYEKSYVHDWTQQQHQQQQCRLFYGDEKERAATEVEQAVVDSFVNRACHCAPLLVVCDLLRDNNFNLAQRNVKLLAKSVERLCYAREAEKLSRELELRLNLSTAKT